MKLLTGKNFLLVLAALLVVALGFMAVKTITKPKTENFDQMELQEIQTQSNSDSLESIDADLKNTDLDNTDKELQDIQRELDSGQQ